MADGSSDLIIEILRRIQSDVAELKADNREIKIRLGSLEGQMAHLIQMAEISTRMDRRDEQMDRVLRRLELTEASH